LPFFYKSNRVVIVLVNGFLGYQMLRVFQEKSGVGGDCLRASSASFFDLSLTDVPSFELFSRTERKKKFISWLNSRGYKLVEQRTPPSDDQIYLTLGTSPRGTLHCVLSQYGKMIHDPMPGQAGLLDAKMFWLFVPLT
jgi:hypothetical protein